MSLSQARRTAVTAQGLHGARRPTGPPTMRHVQGVIDRLGLLQIDSVNVLARAHLLPVFSRLGAYDTALLDRAAGRAPRRVVETWAHVASYVPPETWPLLEWRRRAYLTEAWGMIAGAPLDHSAELEEVRRLVAEHGPISAAQIHDLLVEAGRGRPRSKVEWGWNWTVAKRVLEYLFFTGEVTSARRNAAFERLYDLPERVLPPHVLAMPPVPDDVALRTLLEIGARAHGLGTARCFKDYFRLRGKAADRAVAELVEDGVLVPVEVRGWAERTYLHRDARLPRRVGGQALLAPFDPLVFERTRLERLFGTVFRIEIYVPEPRRVHGYYVLPFLEDERITARVDLKADRQAGVLRVQAAHAEPWATATTPERLAAELWSMAGWLGLADVVVAPRGDLAASLAGAVVPGPAGERTAGAAVEV